MFGFGEEKTTELNCLPNVDPEKEDKTVKFVFKNGSELVVKCRNFSVTTYGNTITAYEIDDALSDYPLYICTDQINAIVYMPFHV